MSTFRVILQKDGKPLRSLDMEGSCDLVIGRGATADLRLLDDHISRQHARLRIDDDRLVIEDLHSLNGVFVNGRLTHSSCLTESDVVTLGSYTLLVERSDCESMLGQRTSQLPYSSVDQLSQQVIETGGHEALALLYRCSQRLTEPAEPTELCRLILQEILQDLPVKRAFALTRYPGEKRARLAACLPEDPEAERPPLSNTLIRHVLHTRNAVLTTDAQEDERFHRAQSVFHHGIHSVLCVPLHGRHHLFGVLYADADATMPTFTLEHLQIVSIIGQMLGVALENSRLHEKQVEQERLAAIGEAVTNASHCMKNILTGVSGSLEILEEAQAKGDLGRIANGLRIMRSSTERFREIVLNMLAFSKHTDEPQLCPVNLDHLVAEAVLTMQAHAARHQVEIIYKQRPLDVIDADSAQLHRVLLNLLSNAIEACSPKGGSVIVSTWQTDTHTRVSVRDSGKGIAPADMPRLFEAFFTTKGSCNTGLGLPLCHRIVKAHGGELLVSSKPGQGTKFSIILPHHHLHTHDPAQETMDF
ncbi:MAG: FHA domain-containing protein [Candidatus Hydrogenedentes bacterium]|nr:FHA domain-containing protein [Candidatus Hydrogenedentota bacterium]